MGKQGLRGADLLPASLLCSQGNEKLVGVNHQAALRTTAAESAPRSRLLGPVVARSPAPTGTGGGGSAPSPTAICIGKPCHLPRYKQKWWNSGKTGGSFRNKRRFWAALRCCTSARCTLRPAPAPQVNCSRDPEGTRFLSPSFKLLLQTTFNLWRFICNYHRGELQ